MARILIIDDEEPIRFSLRGILEDEGYEVLEAATAEEGLSFKKLRPFKFMIAFLLVA